MSINDVERSYFERLKRLLEEQEALKADLAELKHEMIDGGLTKDRVADLAAVAKLQVMDQAKRARKDEQAQRRAELEGQLSMLPAEPVRRHRASRPDGGVAAAVAGLAKLLKEDGTTASLVGPGIEIHFDGDGVVKPDEPPHDPETGEVVDEPEAAEISPVSPENAPPAHRNAEVVDITIPAFLDRNNPAHPLYRAPVSEAAE